MPESGQIEHLSAGATRVWFAYWVGSPPVFCMASCLVDRMAYAGLTDLPDGTILNVAALRRGQIEVVTGTQPMDDDTFEALLKEAGLARL